MIFKKIDTEFTQFNEESLDDLRETLHKGFTESNGPCGDINKGGDFSFESETVSKRSKGHKSKSSNQKTGKRNRDLHYVIRDLMLALVLCHNVTPTFPKEEDPNYKEF